MAHTVSRGREHLFEVLNDTETVQLLMEKGAPIDEREKRSLLWALSHRNLDMLKAMLNAKPDLARLFPYGPTLGNTARNASLGGRPKH